MNYKILCWNGRKHENSKLYSQKFGAILFLEPVDKS